MSRLTRTRGWEDDKPGDWAGGKNDVEVAVLVWKYKLFSSGIYRTTFLCVVSRS